MKKITLAVLLLMGMTAFAKTPPLMVGSNPDVYKNVPKHPKKLALAQDVHAVKPVDEKHKPKPIKDPWAPLKHQHRYYTVIHFNNLSSQWMKMTYTVDALGKKKHVVWMPPEGWELQSNNIYPPVYFAQVQDLVPINDTFIHYPFFQGNITYQIDQWTGPDNRYGHLTPLIPKTSIPMGEVNCCGSDGNHYSWQNLYFTMQTNDQGQPYLSTQP